MSGKRPGKPPKPPLKALKGDKQLGDADFFKPSNRTASEKKAAEGEAAKARAERVARGFTKGLQRGSRQPHMLG
jgi:hypothetical protein